VDLQKPPSSPDPRERRARDLVSSLYDGLTDSHDEPMFEHMSRVAENCQSRAKVLGWLHDSVEDGLISPDEVRRAVQLTTVESAALDLLTRRDSADYDFYIERLATDRSPAGALARDVKIADLRANLSRPPLPDRPGLELRYRKALRRLGG
jgi:hypothetical protein